MKYEPINLNQAAILKSRASILAEEPKKASKEERFIEIVEFRLASETYGIESLFIREIHPLKDYTPLPGVPAFVLGITNVRGQILSIVDLKKFFNLPDNGLGELNKLIILHSGRMEFGVLADAIIGTRSLPIESVQTPPVTVTGIGAEYLKGVTGEGLIVLDAGKILNDKENIVIDLVS